jgi:hypothetical protein
MLSFTVPAASCLPERGKHDMKHLILAAILAGGTALAAHAETFTFTGTSTLSNALSVTPAGGKPVEAAFNTGKGQTIMASGKKLDTTNTCAAWSAMPGGIFDELGMCTFTDATGAGSILFGCNLNNKDMTGDCWGGLWGTGGAYTGKRGSISWHNTLAADGKTGASAGTGQWNN